MHPKEAIWINATVTGQEPRSARQDIRSVDRAVSKLKAQSVLLPVGPTVLTLEARAFLEPHCKALANGLASQVLEAFETLGSYGAGLSTPSTGSVVGYHLSQRAGITLSDDEKVDIVRQERMLRKWASGWMPLGAIPVLAAPVDAADRSRSRGDICRLIRRVLPDPLLSRPSMQLGVHLGLSSDALALAIQSYVGSAAFKQQVDSKTLAAGGTLDAQLVKQARGKLRFVLAAKH